MHTNQENPLKRKKSIRELPNEVLLTIFSYLQANDVKYGISNVCVRWSDLAKDKKLWDYLNFRTTNKSTKTFGIGSWFSTLKFLESTPQLRNITVSRGHSEEEVAEILISLNGNCRNLRHVEFEMDMALVAKHLKPLEGGICENVESLKVNLGSGSSQSTVFKVLSQFKKLRKITFVGSNPESSSFRTFLRDAPGLEGVNVSEVDFSKTNFMSLWNFKDKFTDLNVKIDNLDVTCLKLLAIFPRLKRLNLSDGNSSPEKLSKVGTLKCLRGLYLQEAASSPVLTASALSGFFQDGLFLNLKELILHKSRLDDEGARQIRRKCLSLIYLEVMTYPKCASCLSEKALIHFLHCKRLEHFEIFFDSSEETDWIYRRIRHVRHDCDIDEICPLGLEELLNSWDEIQIPVD